MQKKYLAGLMGIFLLAGGLPGGASEFEVNLVHNGALRPGFDRQGPYGWNYWPRKATSLTEEGRGYIEFFEGGMTVAGPATLMQFDRWDDVTPGYKLAVSMKSSGAKGRVEIRPRDRVSGQIGLHSLVNRVLDEWEDLELVVMPTDHYGFGMAIRVPDGGTLSISNLRVTAVLPPVEAPGKVTIRDGAHAAPARGIRLPAAPNWAEELAAHELRVNIYLVSGVALPVFTGTVADTTGYIQVRNLQRRIPMQPPGALALGVDPEANGFRIACADGNVALVGGNDAGILAGAMHLSELLGAKFYAPRVYSITTNHTLNIPVMDIVRQPAFEWADGVAGEHFTWTPWKYGFLHPDSCVAPGSSVSPPGGGGWVHPPKFLAPLFMYAGSNPEYYALVDGKRIVEGFNAELAYMNLCLGNPGLHKLIAERLMRLMAMYPQVKYFSIAQGDGQRWCECELCTALDEHFVSFRDEGSVMMDRLMAYANAVAEITSKKYPDRQLLILAYGIRREELPLREKLHPNVAVQYALWPSSWPVWQATDCPQNQGGMELLDEWNAFTGTNLTLFLYPVNTYENAEKIKLAAQKGLRGFYHCGWRGDFPETTIYTTGRLTWNPDANVEEMLDEIMPRIYGAGAPFMREYFDMHHAFIRECVAAPGKWSLCREFATNRFRRVPLEYGQRALVALDKAEAASGEDAYALMTIQREKYKLLYAYINEFLAVHDHCVPEENFNEYAARLAELVALARKCREPWAGWRTAFSEWLHQITGGALDFDRRPYQWFNDDKIDAFLIDPVAVLKTRVYPQATVEGGIELPARAWLGSRYFEKYHGRPASVLRRKSSPESRVAAYFKLDEPPVGDVELRLEGLDNEKEEVAEIVIMINGRKIFAGPAPYPKNKWDWRTYVIPAGMLKKGENVIAIENVVGDYKTEMVGEAGPAEEALAQNYNWGWCMVGQARIIWNQK